MTDEGTPGDPSRARTSRRGWRARWQVAAVLVGIALLSVVAVGLYDYFRARQLLNDGARVGLVDIGASRANVIENGVAQLQGIVATMADDQGVTEALTGLAAAFEQVDEDLSDEQQEELLAFYENEVSSSVAVPDTEPPTVQSLVPVTDRARYLQYHYIVDNPFPEDRAELVAAEDESAYQRAHAQYHPMLRSMAGPRLGDVLLIDADSSSVVYSLNKRTDFATDLAAGPHRQSGLAQAVLDRLATAAADEAVVVDFAPYAPARGAPSLFVAATVRDGQDVVGAVAAEIPVDALNAITTAGGDWAGTGLGETGEIYVVGPDRLMRSDSRLWLENPAAYRDAVLDAGYEEAVIEAVEAFGSTALIQPVGTEAVETALAGDFSNAETSTNYLGEDTLSVAGPLDIPGVQWAMVAEVATSEAFAPLADSLNRVLVLVALLVPLIAIAGVYLARRLLRPLEPAMVAVQRVGEGDLDVHLPAEDRNEFGELGRSFNALVAAMREQGAELARTDAETTELLAAVVPSRFVDQVKAGDRELVESLRNTTVVAISIDTPGEVTGADLETIADTTVDLLADVAEVAAEYGLEQVHSSASQQLYAVGLASEGAESTRALQFAVAARDRIEAFGEERGITFDFRGGLAAGDVLGAVVGTDRIAFDMWGQPPHVAQALAAVAHPGQILVDTAVSSEVATDWELEQAEGLTDVSGEPLPGWSVEGKREDTDAQQAQVVP